MKLQIVGLALVALVAAAALVPSARAYGSFSVPSADSVLQSAGTRQPLDVNAGITGGYQRLAVAFQDQVVGRKTASGADKLPVWFVFGVHASHVVGVNQLAAKAALDSLTKVGMAGYPTFVCDELKASSKIGWKLGTAICATIDTGSFAAGILRNEAQLAGYFYANLALAGLNAYSEHQLRALLDTDTIVNMASNMYDAIKAQPPADFLDKVISLVRTLQNGLKHGNIAIYSDIGAAGERFLKWWLDQPARPSADNVVDAAATIFPSSSQDEAAVASEARLLYDEFVTMAKAKRTSPEFYKWPLFAPFSRPPSGSTRSKTGTLVVAGFALYTRAGDTSTSDSDDERATMIKWGNILLAYREQAVSVDPTFQLPLFKPIMKAMTPLVFVGDGRAKWTLVDYVQAQPALPPTGFWQTHVWGGKKPPMSLWDWTFFDDRGAVKGRWLPINDAFRVGYKAISTLWGFPAARVTF